MCSGDVPVAWSLFVLEQIRVGHCCDGDEMLSRSCLVAEDVVRGKVRAGLRPAPPGLSSRIETAAGIGAVLVDDPMRCVIRGAAEILERKDKGGQSGPGLRQ